MAATLRISRWICCFFSASISARQTGWRVGYDTSNGPVTRNYSMDQTGQMIGVLEGGEAITRVFGSNWSAINLISVQTLQRTWQKNCESWLAKTFTGVSDTTFSDVTDGDGRDSLNPQVVHDPFGNTERVETHNHGYNPLSDPLRLTNTYAPVGGSEIIRKDGKIFDEDGNDSGTYVRTSFDDLSDEGNALIFGPNSIGEQGIKKGKLVGALAGGAVLAGACIGTGTCAV